MHWALLALAVIVLVGLVMAAVGSRLPREHMATVRIRLKAAPDSVWAVLNDPLNAAAWRKDVKKVTAVANVDGRPAWTEESGSGTITYVLAQSSPPSSRVTRIHDESLPFGGEWEYVVRADGTGTEVVITERGFVKPALFRFLARYLFGYTKSVEDYLSALAARFGEAAIPEVVVAGR